MPYTREQVFAARNHAKDPWSVGNDVLYGMCKEHPRHTKRGEVVAKLWLIGKSYSAALDRGRSHAGGAPLSSDDFYCECAAPALMKSNIDARLAELPLDTELSPSLLAPVLKAHGALVDVFETVAGKSHRSLASKYLHFHRPELFFIYDSRARAALDNAEPAFGTPRMPRGADRSYAGFVHRAMRYRERLTEGFGVRLTPRELDRLFLRARVPA
jgi:hypothetical protein